MNITPLLSDDAVLAELGERLGRLRVARQMTQAALAEQAGVSKRTVERIEAGASAQVSSVIRVLRVLDLLPNLDHLVPPAGPRPMDLLKRKGKPRRRASSRDDDQAARAWSWDEDA